jgi:hypothetical protein
MSHLDQVPFITGRSRYHWHLQWAIDHPRAEEAAVHVRRMVRAGFLDALEFGDHAEVNRVLRRRCAEAELDLGPIRTATDVEDLIAAVGPTRGHLERRATLALLVATLDEVVDGWRFLAPVAGPADPVPSPIARRQSWATGLSWLPPFEDG